MQGLRELTMLWLREECFREQSLQRPWSSSSLECPRNRKGPQKLMQSSGGDSNHCILSSGMLMHGLYPILWTSLVFTSYLSWLPKCTVNSKNIACDFYSLCVSLVLLSWCLLNLPASPEESKSHKAHKDEQIPSRRLRTPLPTRPPTLVVSVLRARPWKHEYGNGTCICFQVHLQILYSNFISSMSL